jgi:hypothetical protein
VTLVHPTPILVNRSQTQGAGDATSSASVTSRHRRSWPAQPLPQQRDGAFFVGHRLERSAANALFIGIRYQAAPFGRLILG